MSLSFKCQFENLPQYLGNNSNAVIRHPDYKHVTISLNNDLEAMFESTRMLASISEIQNIKYGYHILSGYQYSFLYQKLTDDELKLIQKKNPKFLKNFLRYGFQGKDCKNLDIDEKQMKDSESKSRFALFYSFRISYCIDTYDPYICHIRRKHNKHTY